jgi:hypothetical protein
LRASAPYAAINRQQLDVSSLLDGLSNKPRTLSIRLDSLASPYQFGPRFPEMVLVIDIPPQGGFMRDNTMTTC